MIRILSAIGAIALIIAGVMMMTQQGMFADSVKFDPFGDSGQWSNRENAQAWVTGEMDGSTPGITPSSVIIPPPPSCRHSH
ncbi:hypothetical protein KGV55_03255 [Candidatus Gracilibacteria bacterium]|nr:hypothetical protein [Candidatus Gracilibacteria bacterium]